MNKIIIALSVAVMFLLPACSGVKNLTKPQLDLPETFAGFNAADSASMADLSWWEFYADSTLCRILRKVVENNRDLPWKTSQRH